MKTIETPLMTEEKRALRKAIISRAILFFVAFLPVIIFTVYILYLALMSFVEGDQDAFSYIVPILFVLWYAAAYKFIFPQYRNIFKYGQTKQIIETKVLDISLFQNGKMMSYYITTDYNIINTARNVIFFSIPVAKIEKGMTLYLHIIPSVENEILRISASEENQ